MCPLLYLCDGFLLLRFVVSVGRSLKLTSSNSSDKCHTQKPTPHSTKKETFFFFLFRQRNQKYVRGACSFFSWLVSLTEEKMDRLVCWFGWEKQTRIIFFCIFRLQSEPTEKDFDITSQLSLFYFILFFFSSPPLFLSSPFSGSWHLVKCTPTCTNPVCT
jgi:hypothetical protein